VSMPSIECVNANEKGVSPIALASTASTASTVSTFSGGSSFSTSLRERLPKSMRLTSKQAHAVRKETAIEKAETTNEHNTAMKEATILFQNEQDVAKEDGNHKKMTGLGLLMHGGPSGSCPESPMLENAVEIGFSEKRIGDAWNKKLGVVPFTRAALNDKKVRHEIVLNEDGKADDAIDPKSKHLEELRILNNA
jgi:hypothetical protein